MLQQVVLETTPPTTLDIDAVNPDDIIIVKSISGLDPADVTLFTGEFARAGGYYQGRRPGQRNPVFNLKLNPDYAGDIEVSDIREMLYSWFFDPSPTVDYLKVVLKDDRKPDRYFLGYTEKLPAGIFEQSPTAQVSMICTDPYLKSVDVKTASDAAGWTTLPLDYQGSARNGLTMDFLVKTATNVMTVDLDGVFMTLNRAFAVNDVITIQTIEGQRLIRQNGSDIMASLSSTSKWLDLRKGSPNLLRVHGGAVGDGKVVMTSYTFREAWWGI
jgi:hypothetical protein